MTKCNLGKFKIETIMPVSRPLSTQIRGDLGAFSWGHLIWFALHSLSCWPVSKVIEPAFQAFSLAAGLLLVSVR